MQSCSRMVDLGTKTVIESDSFEHHKNLFFALAAGRLSVTGMSVIIGSR